MQKKSKPIFKTAKEEIDFLRRWVTLEVQKADPEADAVALDDIAHEALLAYRTLREGHIQKGLMRISEQEIHRQARSIDTVMHDEAMEELLGFLLTYGVRNTLTLLSFIQNPRLRNDFYFFLIRYLGPARRALTIRESSTYFTSLDIKIYEIRIPDLLSQIKSGEFSRRMEKVIASLISLGFEGAQGTTREFSIEIVGDGRDKSMHLYMSLPERLVSVFDTEIHHIFPEATLIDLETDPIASLVSGNTVVVNEAVFGGSHGERESQQSCMDGFMRALESLSSKESIGIQVVCHGTQAGHMDLMSHTKIDSVLLSAQVRFIANGATQTTSEILTDILLAPIGTLYFSGRGVLQFPPLSFLEVRTLIDSITHRTRSRARSVALSIREVADLFRL